MVIRVLLRNFSAKSRRWKEPSLTAKFAIFLPRLLFAAVNFLFIPKRVKELPCGKTIKKCQIKVTFQSVSHRKKYSPDVKRTLLAGEQPSLQQRQTNTLVLPVKTLETGANMAAIGKQRATRENKIKYKSSW